MTSDCMDDQSMSFKASSSGAPQSEACRPELPAVGRIPTMAEVCNIDEDTMKSAIGFGVRALEFHEGDFKTTIVKRVWDAVAFCLNNDLPATPALQVGTTAKAESPGDEVQQSKGGEQA